MEDFQSLFTSMAGFARKKLNMSKNGLKNQLFESEQLNKMFFLT